MNEDATQLNARGKRIYPMHTLEHARASLLQLDVDRYHKRISEETYAIARAKLISRIKTLKKTAPGLSSRRG